MANPLTGDFDVVAQFSITAANRVLAAMHRAERFPHSLTLRIDDTPEGTGLHGTRLQYGKVAVSIVDQYGQAALERLAPTARPFAGQAAIPHRPLLRSASAGPDLVVNDRPLLGRNVQEIAERSELRGTAQLQLSTPTISLPDQSGNRATIQISIMSRYVPDDAATAPMPEFLRGDIRISVGIDKAISQAGDFMDVSLKSNNVQVDFIHAWHSASSLGQPVPFGDPQKRLVKSAVRNAILTGFQPYNAVLPESIGNIQFRALPAGPAIALMLSMENWDSDPASAASIFLTGTDDFALAASAEFLGSLFGDLEERVKAIRINVESTLADYVVTVDSAAVTLQNGHILVTAHGQARTNSIFENFTFTITQALGLELVDADGTMDGAICTAQLTVIGDISLDIHVSGLASAILQAFKGSGLNRLRKRRNAAIEALQPAIRNAFNADRVIGEFLKSLMNPPKKPGGIDPVLGYLSVDITTAGVVLHGSLAVPDWPPVHAEIGITADDFSALNSWIPGGTIQAYAWARPWQTAAPTVDENRFVLPRTAGESSTRMCVTVAGTRIPASGPVAGPLPRVSAQTCRWMSLPVTGRFERIGKDLPMVALTQMTSSGTIEVTAYTSPWATRETTGSANLIVHFPDENGTDDLEFLPRALQESERDEAVIILVVVGSDRLARIKAPRGVHVTDDPGDAWERLLNVSRRPSTYLVTSAGAMVWWQHGDFASRHLAGALRAYLTRTDGSTPYMLEAAVRVGQPPPNFIFEPTPGRELLLRKLTARPVTLVFWKSSSAPCLEMLRRLEHSADKGGRPRQAVLAINDGEEPELARKVAARHAPSAVMVPDPKRQISSAYGVNVWPTTIFVDALGLVSDIRYGLFDVDEDKRSPDAKTAAAR